jgi:hypothetical protein
MEGQIRYTAIHTSKAIIGGVRKGHVAAESDVLDRHSARNERSGANHCPLLVPEGLLAYLKRLNAERCEWRHKLAPDHRMYLRNQTRLPKITLGSKV